MGIRPSAWDDRKGFAGHYDSKEPVVFGPYEVYPLPMSIHSNYFQSIWGTVSLNGVLAMNALRVKVRPKLVMPGSGGVDWFA